MKEDFKEEFTPEERLAYLLNKQKWLADQGYSLRPSRLKELTNLMIKYGEFPAIKNVEHDEKTLYPEPE